MKMFATYDEQGRYTWFGSATVGAEVKPGPGIYVGVVNIQRQYHDLATDGPVDMPPSPSPHHVFNWQNKVWDDLRTLTDFKDAQWSLIKIARTDALNTTFVWDGSEFDCNAEGQTNIRAAADRARRDATVILDWRLADNSKRALTASELSGLGDALDVYVAAQHAKASALRDQIYAATTVAQVTAINWF